MNGFATLPLRYARHQRARAVLTASGVTLGVALLVGAITMTSSITGSLDTWIADAKGLTDLIATPAGRAGNASSPFSGAGTGYVDEGAVTRISSLPDVHAVVPLLGLPSAIDAGGGRRTDLLVNRGSPVAVVGTDLAAARAQYTLEAARGRLPGRGREEIAVTAAIAHDLGLSIGNAVQVATPTGDHPAVIVGMLTTRGIGRLEDVAITSLETTQAWVGKPGAVSHLAIRLDDGVDAEAWKETQGPVLSPLQVTTSGASLAFGLSQLTALGTALTVLAAGVVLVAGFLVFLTVSTSIVERVRLYGILQALGATQTQVRNLVLAEAGAIGVGSSILGCAGGIAIARALVAATSRFVGAPAPVRITPAAFLAGMAMGVAVTVLSALVPARRAARLDPVAAIRADFDLDDRPARTWIAGVATLVVGVGALLGGKSDGTLLVGMPTLLLGAILTLPAVIRPLAAALGALTSRAARGVGHVAILHLAKERTRSSYTLALVMCVLALAIATASARHSFDQALANELDATFGWDLSLIAASTFTDDFAAAAASVEGVAAVAPVAETLGSFTVDGRRELAQIRGIDQRYFDVSGFRWVEGDDASGRRALGTRGSVLFPKATAARLGLHAGDDLTFETDQGPRPLHIAAVVTYSNAVPTMFVGADTASTYFGASAPGQLLVKVRPGVATDDVRGRLQTTLASKATFIVGTVSDVKADIRDQIAAGVNGFQLLLLLAGVVGLLGLGNTLVVSAVQRYRETGIIRALGARRSQVAAASLVEALTLALAAVVLAIPLGALIGAPVVRAVVHGVGDLSITYRFAWSALPPLVLITLAVAATCSILPARRATKLDIDAALRFE